MAGKKTTPPKTNVGRRRFLQTSAGAAAVLSLASGVHADGDNILRIGLIGCGGRGTGAAANALKADPNVRLTAMGDAFRDRLNGSLAELRRDRMLTPKIDVPRERQFVGFDAYREVIGSGVDVVLLCTPPHFRPAHLDAAVRANKHVFCEKPVAVDAPGVRRVLATCQEAGRRRLSIVSGLCWRYHGGMREAFTRIHDGAVGNIVALQCSYNTGTLWHRNREQDWSDMEWQIRNWLYFTWLSGDFNVEQHVHLLDVCSWLMNEQYPVRAVGMGGRQVRTGAEYGHIYDHFSVVYQYASGAKLFSQCRQQKGCKNDISTHAQGTKGSAHLSERTRGQTIQASTGDWTFDGPENEIYQTEHDELFASIRRGKPVDNGEYMAKSTLLAIMGRMAAYTGQVITWDMALKSREDLTPPRYAWDIPLTVPTVAMPGVTKFA